MNLRARRIAAVIVAVEELAASPLARRLPLGESKRLLGVDVEDVREWIFKNHYDTWEELFAGRASRTEIIAGALLEAHRSEMLLRTRDKDGVWYRPVPKGRKF